MKSEHESEERPQAPAWIEVRVSAPIGFHELVGEALALAPCTAVVYGRTSIGMDAPPAGFDFVRTFYSTSFDSEELREGLRKRLDDLAQRAQLPELADLELRYRELPPEDFATSWKKTWRPFRIGRLCVVPPDFERDVAPDELRLVLEPGGVFGTGRHATTRSVLHLLQGLVASGDRIVDAGAGTGILGVAAALLGAGEVFGFDIDPHSPEAARLLAQRSGVEQRCRFVSGGFECLGQAPSPADGMLANIYADVLQEFAPPMAGALKPGGWFVFSGCLDVHAAATREALESAGLAVAQERLRGRWNTFAGRRVR